MISAIVAVDNNWGIGYNGDLLEHIPGDLKHFKELTTGHVVVMGRKTWDSLPHKPLPDRLNLVITRQERNFDDMTAFIPLEEVVVRMQYIDNDEEWFIIGGGMIYKELLPYCDRVYVTKINKNYENVDTYFPNLDELIDDWTIACHWEPQLEHNDLTYQFWEYVRIS